MSDYLKNIVHTQIFFLANICFGLITLFFLTKNLQTSDYGKYVVIQGLIAILGFVFSQNIHSYTRLKIPGSKGIIQNGYLKSTLLVILIPYLCFVLFIYLFDISDLFLDFSGVDISDPILFFVILGIELVNLEYIRFMIATSKVKIKNKILLVQKIVVLLSIVVFFYLDELSLNNILISLIIGQLCVFFFSSRIIRPQLIIKSKFNYNVIKFGYKVALPLLPVGLVSIAMNYIDILMVSKIVGGEELGQYALASQLINIGFMVISNSVILTLFPYAVEMHNKRMFANRNVFFIRMLIIGLSLAAILYVILIINSTMVINAFEYIKYSDVPYFFIYLAFIPILQIIHNVFSHHLQLMSVFRFQLLIAVFVIIENVILNYVFIDFYGVIGAAYGSIISMLTLSALYFYKSISIDQDLKDRVVTKKMLVVAISISGILSMSIFTYLMKLEHSYTLLIDVFIILFICCSLYIYKRNCDVTRSL